MATKKKFRLSSMFSSSTTPVAGKNSPSLSPSLTPSSYISPLTKTLRDTHARNLASFKSILREEHPPTGKFWDIIVVTACDEPQKLAYQMQIARRIQEGEIPGSVKYHVVADPPGQKIGSGGSTLVVLKYLRDVYGETMLSRMCVLIVHAGGFSKRMPHVSAVGKIFTNLPVEGTKGMRMLDLKLILYIDYVKNMKPGIFLTSADGIELLHSNHSIFPFSTHVPSIIAFTHPSPLSVGTTHGVFLLDDPDGDCKEDMNREPVERMAILKEVRAFLHKPPKALMREREAVQIDREGKEFVYTDSAYYFDHTAAKIMLELYEELTPLTYELEAWADFLSFSTVASDPIPDDAGPQERARALISERLTEAGTRLQCLVMNSSSFYHAGTMEEILKLCCADSDFRTQLGITTDAAESKVGSAAITSTPTPTSESIDGGSGSVEGVGSLDQSFDSSTPSEGMGVVDSSGNPILEGLCVKYNGKVIGSLSPAAEFTFVQPDPEWAALRAAVDPSRLSFSTKAEQPSEPPIWKSTQTIFREPATTIVYAPSLIEFSEIEPACTVGAHSILSNIKLPRNTRVPDDTCMFMLKVRVPPANVVLNSKRGAVGGFVTFVLSTRDDTKKSVRGGFINLKVFMNIPLIDVCHHAVPDLLTTTEIDNQQQQDNDVDNNSSNNDDDNEDDRSIVTLWDAEIFPVLRTEEEAMDEAIKFLDRVRSWKEAAAAGRQPTKLQGKPLSGPEIVGWCSLAKMVEWKDLVRG